MNIIKKRKAAVTPRVVTGAGFSTTRRKLSKEKMVMLKNMLR
jgi:hypothetical protein